jgi:hypothetical protein
MPAPLLALPLLAKIGLGASALQGVMGGVQSLTSGARRNERELERMAGQSPTYSGSRELEGFYNEALRRYQQSPYQTAKFIMGRNLADRSQANALGALTQRNSALAGAGRLASVGANQANQLVAQAEAERRQDFGMLGQAGRTLAQDKLTQFDINQMTPYNRKFGLQQMRTQAANERKNAGLQMIGGALSNAAAIGMAGAGMGTEGAEAAKPDYTLSTLQSVPKRNMKMPSAPTSMNPNAKPISLTTPGMGVLKKFKKQPFEMPKLID